MATKKTDYQTLSAELEDVLSALQDPEVRVDDAIRLYEKGLALISELESHLTQAENKITKLTLQTTGRQ